MRFNTMDAQAALGFLIEQTSHIETEVYEMKYPDVQYPMLIPVDESAPDWAKSITFFSSDKVGEAAWFHAAATDMRLAEVLRSKFEQGIEMAAIGYRYNLEEIEQARMIGNNLSADKASAAARAYEEFVDKVAFLGDTAKGWTGLVNNAAVTRVDAANDGVGATRTWSTKTTDQIIRDINDALTGIYTGSNTIEMGDTIILPIAALSILATRRIENTMQSVLDYIMTKNVYTLTTGQPIMVRGVLGLETAGSGGVGRMVVYRRDPAVVKLHIPMRHQFLPVWQRGPLVFDVPGIFRLGGTEWRRPGAGRYVDGITPAP